MDISHLTPEQHTELAVLYLRMSKTVQHRKTAINAQRREYYDNELDLLEESINRLTTSEIQKS